MIPDLCFPNISATGDLMLSPCWSDVPGVDAERYGTVWPAFLRLGNSMRTRVFLSHELALYIAQGLGLSHGKRACKTSRVISNALKPLRATPRPPAWGAEGCLLYTSRPTATELQPPCRDIRPRPRSEHSCDRTSGSPAHCCPWRQASSMHLPPVHTIR